MPYLSWPHVAFDRTPILKSWSEDNFEQHQPVLMFPVGLGQIFGHNLQKSTVAYEKLVGHSAGAAAAAANAAQREHHNKLNNIFDDSSTT